MRRFWAWLGTLVLLLIVAWLGAPAAIRAYWHRQESNPVRRGADIAARSGCFACHGAQGACGLPDPGTGETVPTWDGGVPMMYVAGEPEIREYILEGVTKRRAASAGARALRQKAAIQMPAYRDVLQSAEVDDLVAYVMAVWDPAVPGDPRSARGRELVRQHRCESCHGVAGSGGVPNPRSLKGYVPGWLGEDYNELVRDDGELKQWILEGGIDRFARDRLAGYFLARQRLQMPVYRAVLTPDDAEAIGTYIRTLRARR